MSEDYSPSCPVSCLTSAVLLYKGLQLGQDLTQHSLLSHIDLQQNVIKRFISVRHSLIWSSGLQVQWEGLWQRCSSPPARCGPGHTSRPPCRWCWAAPAQQWQLSGLFDVLLTCRAFLLALKLVMSISVTFSWVLWNQSFSMNINQSLENSARLLGVWGMTWSILTLGIMQ